MELEVGKKIEQEHNNSNGKTHGNWVIELLLHRVTLIFIQCLLKQFMLD